MARIILAVLLVSPEPAVAQTEEEKIKKLEGRVAELEQKAEQSELEALRREAEAEAPDLVVAREERQFRAGELGLQKLNPEISVVGDITAGLILNAPRFYGGADDRSGMPVRLLGLHLQHALDPFSRFKATVNFIPEEGAELEEVYVSWRGLFGALSISFGRFRQSFGVLNRWHEHALDQVSHPLAFRLVLGDEGLVANGLSFEWLMPSLIADANTLILEVTDGDNEVIFAGEMFSAPAGMLHLKNYYDLSESTYLEWGLSGMVGFNNQRGVASEGRLVDEPWRKTFVGGADLTVHWQPPQRARYRSFTWRSEGVWVQKEAPSGDFSRSWGFYSYVTYQLATQWFCGARVDMVLPTERAVDKEAWDAVAYLTFWQSEYVFLRLEYTYGHDVPFVRATGDVGRRIDNRVLLQVDFAAGPHKHEKY